MLINLLLLLSRFSCVQLCATPKLAAYQAPLSLGFSRQEYWTGLPFPSLMHACMLSRFSRVRLGATLYGQQPSRLDSTCKLYPMIFDLLCLTSLSVTVCR